MDESFIREAFSLCQEPVDNVIIQQSKVSYPSGGNMGYAFVTFKNPASAQRALSSLNGQQIPNHKEVR